MPPHTAMSTRRPVKLEASSGTNGDMAFISEV
jgi:hypothetical protein